MNGSISIAIFIVAIVRALLVRHRVKTGRAKPVSVPGLLRTSVYGVLKLLLVWPLFLGASTAWGVVVLRGAPLLAAVTVLLVVLGCIVWTFPWIVARVTIVPFGAYRAAYYLGRGAGVLAFYDDQVGGACLLAAWSLSRRARVDEIEIQWIERRLGKCKKPYGACLAAAGILHTLRKEDEKARALFLVVDLLAARDCAPAVRRLARRWIVADLARRGLWQLVPRFDPATRSARATRFPRLAALSRSMREAAAAAGDRWLWTVTQLAREIAAPSAGWRHRIRKGVLAARWRLSPHRREVHAAFERAGRRDPEEPLPAPPADQEDSLGRALALHRDLLIAREAGERTTPRAIARVAAAWDAVRASSEIETRIGERAQVLGVQDADSVFSRLLSDVEEDLCEILFHAELPIERFTDAGPTLDACLWAARERHLSALEDACLLLEERKRARRALDSLGECAEFGRLRDLHLRAVALAGADACKLVFPQLHYKMSHFAVWLENREVRERFVSHPIFQWLLAEARIAGDEEAIKLETKNVAVTILGRP